MPRAEKRETNQELIERLKAELTAGCPVEVLATTKAWRTKLWATAREIERRMCPQPPERVDGG